ncbi:hypothetical protein GUJ93_ZPchr1933g22902 [Zizania palustris]|uniref:Uncharacterized protein n=1 Tax=Zizania palustris TaxID=103762 RepID=A0A8J5V399_ZIZPA|nr:hypothetical protein GUJ93_ZPchr1933g22902 [Zizania palustris]
MTHNLLQQLCILHGVYLGAGKASVRPPSCYAVFKERLLSGTLGPDDARHLFDEVLLDCDLAKAPNQLLSALARAPPSVASSDGPAFAIELFKRMDRCASPQAAPNGYTYNILIDCYRRAHRPDLGLAIFGRLLKTGFGLNVVAYSTVIDSFFKEGEVDKAYDIFCEMKKQGISPNVVTYNSTIDGLCKSKAMDKAYDLFREMKNKAFHLIMGRLSDALEKFNHMVDVGVPPNSPVYSCLIQGHCIHGDLVKANELISEMMNKGIPPPCIKFFNSIINNLCKEGRVAKVGDMKEALRIVDVMTSVGVEPDAGRTNTAKKIFNEMIDCGMTVSNATYNIVLGGLCRNNCTDEAIMLLDKLFAMNIKNDVVIFTTMISAMFKVGRREEAKKLFAAISTYGLVPDMYTYGVMINNLIKEDSFEEADNIFSSMEKSGCAPDSRLLNGIIRTLLRKAEVAKAGNYLSKIDENNFAVEASTASLLLSLFSMEEQMNLGNRVHF